LNGDMSMNSRLFVTGDVSMGSRLFVNGDVSMNSRLFVAGDVSMGSRLFVNGDVSMNSRLFVAGDVSMGARLYVMGDVSFNSRLFLNGDTSMNSRLFVTGDVSMGSRLFVNGDVSMNSRLFVTGDVSMNSRLFVSNDVSMNGNLYTLGRTIHQGDVSINSRLFVGNDVLVYGRLSVQEYTNTNIMYTNVTTSNYTLIIAEDLSLNGRLNAYYDASFSSRLFVGSTQTSTAYTNGALTVAGGAGIGGNIYVNGTNNYISGNLGIGTTTPLLQLDVSGGIGSKIHSLYVNAQGDNGTFAIGSYGSKLAGTFGVNYALYQGTSGDTVLNAATGQTIQFKLNNTEYMRLHSTGNIGIGTQSPSYTLDVTGITRVNQSTINNFSLLSYNSTNAVNTMFFIPYLGAGGFNSISAANDTGIFWGNAAGSATGGLVIAPWATGPNGIRMDKNGNVGIGVSVPGCALDVNGHIRIANGSSFTSTGDIRFTTPSSNTIYINNDKTSGDVRFNYSGGLLNTSSAIRCYGSDGTATTKENFTVLNNGKIGIGSSTPPSTLDIVTTYASVDSYSGGLVVRNNSNSASQSSSILVSVGGTNAGTSYFATDILGYYGFSHGMTPASSRYSFKSNYNFTGTEVMSLLSNGNVGINNTAPTNKFQVSGGNYYTSLIATSVGSGTFGYGAVQQIASNGQAIGSTAGSYTPLLQLSSLNGNVSFLNFYTYRNANGADWTTTSTRIQQGIDFSAQGYIEFNSNTNNYGIGMYGSSGLGIVVSQGGIVNLNATSVTHTISSTTACSSSSTGALVVSGGVGIGGALFVGGTGTFTGDVRTSSKLYIGVNDPGGGGGDYAMLEYVAYSGEATVLRLNTMNDNNDNINLNPSGNVGINKDSPTYDLDVNGTVNATSYNATSDIRIKTNIININGTYAVDVLRKLEPKKYSYIDNDKQDEYTWGFIGQDLENCFEYSTTKSKEYIPNIYDYSDLSNDKIIKLQNKSTTEFLLNSLTDPSLCKVRLLTSNKKTEIIRTIDKIIDDKTFSIVEPITQTDLSGNSLFVYGQMVDDFRSVNHTSVFTLTTAAVKEIDKELQKALSTIEDQNKTIQNLTDDVNELKAMVAVLMNK